MVGNGTNPENGLAMSRHTLKSGVGKLNMIHRIIRVSLRLILGTDPGDACARQLNWSLTAFAHVSAATTRVASVTG